ncbi:hypothetical protein RN001_003393 [Aquatica leii]|uniref:Speckle targeted PIP5K1A-regulated poly(A) polymerase n=1 Tax=Aquatica leii TaxID=1421715 RepID=A0AAN7Q9I1_9COLE|nr:hypothetical protein RN001_003393 [Aquatica leii]
MDENNDLFCKMCNVLLPNKQSQEQHLLGKKHQLVAHRLKIKETKETCGVFVKGFPVNTKLEHLKEFLSTYGEIVDSFCGEKNHFAIIQFKNPESVEALLKEKLEFSGRNLFISRRVVKKQEQWNGLATPQGAKDVVQKMENFKEINDHLRNIASFDNQLIALTQCLQPNWPDMIQKYQHLCHDLQHILIESFPNCVVYPFGSTISRLSFISSDVDVFVKVVATNISVPDNDHTHKAVTYVKKAKKLLDKHPQKFSQIFAIPKAKTPIVKCVHNPTMIHCDFNFKNMLGVCNTSLIQYFLSLDNRLTFLMISIKYWAKVHDLSGSRGKFSNYSFIMLFIFYLQQGKYLIPSVRELQELPHNVCIQEGWNGGFNKMSRFTNNLLKNFSMSDILLGFFDYYANFDYSLNIVCPYLGNIVLKTDFIKPECLPYEFELYKNNIANELPLKVDTPICVQDPFEHSHNVISCVSAKLLEEFICLCKKAVDFLKSPIDNLTLYKLFTEGLPSNQVQHTCTKNSCEFTFTMGSTCLSYLNHLADLKPEDELDSNEKVVKLRNAWYSLVNEFILNFLTKVMKFSVTLKPIDDEHEDKALRLEEQTDVHDTNIISSVGFICTGMYNLWETRKSISKSFEVDKSLSFLETQICISDYMSKVYEELKLKEVIVEFEFNAYAKIKPVEVHFEITKIDAKKNFFNTFTIFLSKNLSCWFDYYCKELDSNVNK